ncbi:protein-glutamate methylesterase/protein-glutamine glutaminase [Paenibacillus alkalitolerans]|uniref:protein-glutamate methylesterase/protein-glutamine glutaminase n=1 Tax=Paenibacillus alkalitolerans TaxID=2799335 RepID=UPI0018F77A68|nr:chemotaxis response regulator protein-glutamate methylesterase [Paenibacillus alkalitolerans]
MRKWKVLVVDDSAVFRHAVVQAMENHPLIEVVAAASDPYEARDRIIETEPEVLVLDVEMPRMNGIVFLKKLLPQYPVPVIVMSSTAEHVFEALECGAVDFIAKPNARNGVDVPTFMRELQSKIRVAARARISPHSAPQSQHGHSKEQPQPAQTHIQVIAIGASTGGTEAILSVIKQLPPQSPGIVVVQHMPPGFTKSYADRLNKITAFEVKEAVTGDAVVQGKVLVAPGNMQMKVVKSGAKFHVECFEGPKVSGHCPSVDVLFDSVAQCGGSRSIGVLLTGMGSDGAHGLLNMRKRGARTIGQDESSSVVYGMPKVAYEIGAVEKQLTLQQIPSAVKHLIWS